MTAIGVSDAYAAAGLGGSAGGGDRPAVVVVDLSVGFTSTDYASGMDLGDVITATNSVIEAVRGRGPVVFTTIAFPAGTAEAWLRKMPGLAALTVGSPGTVIDERLHREPTDPIVVKQGASAFFGTSLISTLVADGIDSLIICGATTSGCVRATVVDAVQYGYPVTVPADAVGDRAKEPHDASLYDMHAKYADVLELSGVLDRFAGEHRSR